MMGVDARLGAYGYQPTALVFQVSPGNAYLHEDGDSRGSVQVVTAAHLVNHCGTLTKRGLR